MALLKMHNTEGGHFNMLLIIAYPECIAVNYFITTKNSKTNILLTSKHIGVTENAGLENVEPSYSGWKT